MMPDELILIVGDRQMSGWTSIRVTRGIERCPSDFDIELTELYPGDASAFVIQAGDFCQVKLGNDLVITGYVDRFIPSLADGSHSIRVMGRGKCADLVDCSAEWPGSQISGSSALSIARKLAEPYGKFADGRTPNLITVSSNVADIGPVIPKFNLFHGEKAFDIIERVCRYCALLAYDEPDGNLFLTRVGTEEAASGFAQGVNVQSASLAYAVDNVYSEYSGYAVSVDPFKDIGTDGNLKVDVIDTALVSRHRRMDMVSEQGDTNFNVLTKRVQWEAMRRFGRAFQLNITTDSWRDSAGVLYTPNTLVPISLPALKLADAKWLISEVTYARDEQNGTTCSLTIMPPEAFDLQPVLLLPVFTDVPQAVGK